MRYRLYLRKDDQYSVKQGRLLIDITEVEPFEGELVTAVLLIGGLKRNLSKVAVFGELKKWKNKTGEVKRFVRIDNHQQGKYILTPNRAEEIEARGSKTIDKITDFKRIETDGENLQDFFNTYNQHLADSDKRPFVIGEKNSML